MSSPGEALFGAKLEIVGGGTGVTMKSLALLAVPAVVVTVTGPVVAPVGTVALISVGETILNSAMAPLKRTAETAAKFVPVIGMLSAGEPLGAERLVIVGGVGVPVSSNRNWSVHMFHVAPLSVLVDDVP